MPTRKTALLLLTASVIALGVFDWAWSKRNFSSGLNATLEWSRMLPLPQSATHIDLQATGTMFTRTFVLQFDAPPADIDAWLAASPGTAGRSKESIQNWKTGKSFKIAAGAGAQSANITVSPAGHVRIDASWS